MADTESPVAIERVASKISLVRGERVMLDADLAELYGVPTKVLNQAVTRNRERFPSDFMFRLSWEEFEALRSQTVTLDVGGRGQHRKYPPRAFTEHGVTMLSSALRSKQAVQVNIAIVRAFVRLRQVLATNEDLARRVAKHDEEIAALFKYVQALLESPGASKKQPIGY